MWKRDVFPSVPSPERPGTPLGEIVTSFLLSLLTSSFLEIARNNTSKATNRDHTIETLPQRPEVKRAPSLPKQQPSLGEPGRDSHLLGSFSGSHRDGESHTAVECESRPMSSALCAAVSCISVSMAGYSKATPVCAGGTLPDVFLASAILDSSLRLAGPFQELGLSLPVVSYLKGDSRTVGAPFQIPMKHRPCPNTCFYRDILY